ncbi:hypothetical protein [Mycobacteroides immunogenum]|uniref:hypothetical protein n=1 Tax=Mycobacteroides immunogenum TaxID=83262 RepID=UPI0009BDEEB0|nr:hypothetical protein [Mycobacteroides immunogenum]
MLLMPVVASQNLAVPGAETREQSEQSAPKRLTECELLAGNIKLAGQRPNLVGHQLVKVKSFAPELAPWTQP